jgi:hypothetical protein
MDYANKFLKKYIKFLSICLSLSLFSCVNKSKVNDFPSWMLGEWHHEGLKYNIIENWKVNSDNSTYTGKTTWSYPGYKSIENLKIYLKNDSLHYSVKINSKITIFKTADFDGDTICFQNDKNEFPKYLNYAFKNSSKIVCWIENYSSDPQKQVFEFSKKD